MNPLAEMWLRQEQKRREKIELRKMAEEIREAQMNLRPLLEEANARRKAGMRQDGETGFVMVAK
jgi:flagellar biosynthesis chaperone FliJ